MYIRVLGAAAGGGLPQWNCRCDVCRLAWSGDPRVTPRTQSSIAVSADGRSWALINCAPEVLTQIRRTPALFPQQGSRHTPIESILLTNADVDHVGGLLSLRESSPYRLYATAEIQAVLRDNPIFNVLNPDYVERVSVALEQPLALAEGLEARMFAVPGKTALYLEGEQVDIGVEGEATVGIEFRAAGRRTYYIPGCAAMTPALAARLEGADVLLFDGTLWRDDEMIRAGVGHKTGQRMGHMAMSGETGSMAALSSLSLGRRVFLHINNTNPVLIDDSAERREAARMGWEIAHDGMELEC
ncbi:pyrroloquinoline quinone biosynthesis protein PqqB [Chromohalobacter sarecensis]|uniref:Coenzyme PQQ synthesis protein B n=1 Tax=Chromohalobacter sarecensis TaxID=245294 RepID=A0ABV9D089_9GAMM|nr:pyrroloquinoline quinone biosynthesis protein PqqB [Chromohalobacter sarecensis]MCK0713696.1 pyrroloquinoline quinone biosynthesis protein PqqB [Chromohalobacter sarecensis]